MCDQQSLRSACAYAQSDQSLCSSLAYSMSAKLLTGHHLEFLSLKGGCIVPSESTHVKIPHYWKSLGTAHLMLYKPASLMETAATTNRRTFKCLSISSFCRLSRKIQLLLFTANVNVTLHRIRWQLKCR